jgi:hypothetical protein
MPKHVKVDYGRRECAIVLNVLSKELVRQIHRKITEPALASAVARTAEAREQWNHIPEGNGK